MIPGFIDKTTLPHKPGVYLYKNSKGEIIYVGKAIDLYHRIISYFNNQQTDLKTASLVKNIASCETIIVSSELEALILEANLIKKHLPLYNIRLTDDKDYLYIKVTKEKFPKILTARKNQLDNAKEYFGPFPSSRVVKATLKKLRRFFPWCGGSSFKNRACFYYHLGLCPGSCIGKINSKEYNKNINRFIQFMNGHKEKVVRSLEKEMTAASDQMDFEKAAQIKKVVSGLNYLLQENRVEAYLENPNFLESQNLKALADLKKDLSLPKSPNRIECFDISNTSGQDPTGSLVVLSFGEIDKTWYRRFKIKTVKGPNDVAMIKEVLSRRVKHDEWPKPDLILVDGGKGQVKAALAVLEETDWRVPLFGLAKKMEWLIAGDLSVIKLPRNSLSLQMMQKVRDEAHRFALSFHRKLRQNQVYYGV